MTDFAMGKELRCRVEETIRASVLALGLVSCGGGTSTDPDTLGDRDRTSSDASTQDGAQAARGKTDNDDMTDRPGAAYPDGGALLVDASASRGEDAGRSTNERPARDGDSGLGDSASGAGGAGGAGGDDSVSDRGGAAVDDMAGAGGEATHAVCSSDNAGVGGTPIGTGGAYYGPGQPLETEFGVPEDCEVDQHRGNENFCQLDLDCEDGSQSVFCTGNANGMKTCRCNGGAAELMVGSSIQDACEYAVGHCRNLDPSIPKVCEVVSESVMQSHCSTGRACSRDVVVMDSHTVAWVERDQLQCACSETGWQCGCSKGGTQIRFHGGTSNELRALCMGYEVCDEAYGSLDEPLECEDQGYTGSSTECRLTQACSWSGTTSDGIEVEASSQTTAVCARTADAGDVWQCRCGNQRLELDGTEPFEICHEASVACRESGR